MAKLSRDEVLKLARLAKLSLTDEEVTQYSRELSEILGYVEQLDAVDTDGLEPTSQVTGLVNVMRPDEIRDYGITKHELLKNVPAKNENYIQVKRVL